MQNKGKGIAGIVTREVEISAKKKRITRSRHTGQIYGVSPLVCPICRLIMSPDERAYNG
jgi:hypothetical protein